MLLEGRMKTSAFAKKLLDLAFRSAFVLAFFVVTGYYASVGIFRVAAGDKLILLFPTPFCILAAYSLVYIGLQTYQCRRFHLREFRYDGIHLEYRTMSQRESQVVAVDRIAWVISHHPFLKWESQTIGYSIMDADCRWFVIAPWTMENGEELAQYLQPHAVRNRIENLRANSPTETVPQDHPLLPRIAPHLQPGEQVYWIGGIERSKFWLPGRKSKLAAFGIATLFSLAMLGVVVVFFFFPGIKDIPPNIAAAAAGCALLAWGMLLLADYQWKTFERQLAQCTYAVTSRRALVIDGFFWREGFNRCWYGYAFQEWSPRDVAQYDPRFQRDFILAYPFTKQFRFQLTAKWFQGFMALRDEPAAHYALIRLLDEHSDELFAEEAVAAP